MSRTLDRLRRTPVLSLPTPAAVAFDEPEMPFIEIGPFRSVEGSAGVMAVAAPVQAPPAKPALAGPHAVALRSLAPAKPVGPTFAADVVAFHDAKSAEAARYADLLAALLESADRTARGPARAVLFVSSAVGVGQSTVVANLAVVAARAGKRVALIDANLRRPSVATRTGVADSPGVAEILCGENALIEALRPTAQDRLVALPAGSGGTVVTDAQAVRTLIDVLTGQHDLVLIDGPRWDGRMAALLAESAQAVFLTCLAAEADGPPASELVKELPARGVPLAGCVLCG